MDLSMAKYMDPPIASTLKATIDRIINLFGDGLPTEVIDREVRLAYVEAEIDDSGSSKSIPRP